MTDSIGVVETFLGAMGAQDWNRAEAVLAEEAVHEGSDHKEPVRGRAAIRQAHEGLGKAFPDQRWTLDRIFGQGELVCAETTLAGTHEGPMPGPDGSMIEPTGRRVELPVAFVFVVREGGIAAFTGYGDFLDFYAQLGVVAGSRPEAARAR